MQSLPVQGHRLFFEFQVRHTVADLHGQLVKDALEPGGIQVFDLDGPGHLLVHPRRGEHDVGADLPDVFLGGFRFLGEIDGKTHLKPAGDGHHLFPDPGKGQKGNEIVLGCAGVHLHQVLAHGQHVVMGKERPFGQGRGPGGVEEQGDVFAVPWVTSSSNRSGFSFSSSRPSACTSLQTDQQV